MVTTASTTASIAASNARDNGAAVARRFGVTIKTLRLYEQLGLLQPARTQAGWRVYGPREMARLHTVISLKQMGLPLAAIAELLDGRVADMAALLGLQEQALTAQRAALDRALALIRSARARGDDGEVLDADRLAELVGGAAAAQLRWGPQVQAIAERCFTPQQLKQLEARLPDAAGQAEANAAWDRIYADIDAFPADAAATSEPGLEIGRRAVALIGAVTRGDAAMLRAASSFWRSSLDDPQVSAGLPMRNRHWDFLAAAMAELKARGELKT
jgi:DNA-binding transcriptional MerR regulator